MTTLEMVHIPEPFVSLFLLKNDEVNKVFTHYPDIIFKKVLNSKIQNVNSPTFIGK